MTSCTGAVVSICAVKAENEDTNRANNGSMDTAAQALLTTKTPCPDGNKGGKEDVTVDDGHSSPSSPRKRLVQMWPVLLCPPSIATSSFPPLLPSSPENALSKCGPCCCVHPLSSANKTHRRGTPYPQECRPRVLFFTSESLDAHQAPSNNHTHLRSHRHRPSPLPVSGNPSHGSTR